MNSRSESDLQMLLASIGASKLGEWYKIALLQILLCNGRHRFSFAPKLRMNLKNSVVFASESCDNSGMFRTSVINLLLLAIIACPFNCMGLFLAIHFVAGETVVTCTCCAAASGCESAPSAVRDGENSPDELPKGACPGCICRGALVLSHLESSEIELSVSSSPGSVPFYFFLTVQPGAKQNDTHFDRHTTPPILSGAFVRISHQSLLI